MTSFSSSIARVPNLLISQLSLSRIQQTNLDVFRSQTQLATGRDLLAPSDDPVRAATIATLDDRIGRVDQRLRNLSHADASLGTLDTALGEANDLVLYAQRIASEELNFGSTPEERASQAEVVESIIRGLYDVANRKGTSGHVFGGSHPGSRPVETFLGGYRYVSDGPGILTDIGLSGQVPVTIGASNAIGAISGRIQGDIDLQPQLTPDTRLRDTSGARGTDITLGVIEFSYEGGERVQIDLRGADTFQDLADTIAHAIRTYEGDEGITIL
ncbi:MAG: hypothetical protein KDA28_05065, partial [Phycisphaerales bacterium]|nr:hypothetical protein [Phycisphaerales bacterium]